MIKIILTLASIIGFVYVFYLSEKSDLITAEIKEMSSEEVVKKIKNLIKTQVYLVIISALCFLILGFALGAMLV